MLKMYYYEWQDTRRGYGRVHVSSCPLKRKSCISKPFYRCEHYRHRSFNRNKIPAEAVACAYEGGPR